MDHTLNINQQSQPAQSSWWAVNQQSPIVDLTRSILRSSTAVFGLSLVILLILIAILAPIIAPYDPRDTDLRAVSKTPSASHLLGTDHLGRDILSRTLYGARISLQLGVGSVLIGAVIGVTAGLIMGYFGGRVDTIMSRFVDILLAFRLLLLAIIVVAILGPSLTNTMIAIGLSLAATFARLTRGEVLVAKRREYVEATRSVGGSSARIMFRHILPNIMGPLIVFATLRLGLAILAEASLSFLGLGPPPPTPSWGLMVNEGLNQLRSAWWTSTIPGVAITLVVLSFNLFGDGLRDAMDPRLRRSKA